MLFCLFFVVVFGGSDGGGGVCVVGFFVDDFLCVFVCGGGIGWIGIYNYFT